MPTGLSIDPATVVISGTPTVVSSPRDYRVAITWPTADGGTYTEYATLELLVASPANLYWFDSFGNVGAAFTAMPTTLDASTGVISGTPLVAGSFRVTINVTLSVNGVTVLDPVVFNVTLT